MERLERERLSGEVEEDLRTKRTQLRRAFRQAQRYQNLRKGLAGKGGLDLVLMNVVAASEAEASTAERSVKALALLRSVLKR